MHCLLVLRLDFISYWKSFLLGTLVILLGFFFLGILFAFVLLCILLHLIITLWHGETEHALDFLDALTFFFFSNNILQSLFTYLIIFISNWPCVEEIVRLIEVEFVGIMSQPVNNGRPRRWARDQLSSRPRSATLSYIGNNYLHLNPLKSLKLCSVLVFQVQLVSQFFTVEKL